MKLLSTLTLLLIIQLTQAQIQFEPAYYIDNNGDKTECLIKNIDWRDNPTSFVVKIEGTNKKLLIEDIKEFGFNNGVMYQRYSVDVDMSSPIPGKLSNQRAPIYENKTVFLKVLAEGDAWLYKYVNGNIIRFFYRLNNEEVKPLIYKKFLQENFNIATNETYKQQLSIDLKHPSVSATRISNTKYTAKDLSKLFLVYNGEEKLKTQRESKEKSEEDSFKLNVRPGFNYNSIVFDNSIKEYKTNASSVSLGLEYELILPFNKNKWAVILEPEFFYLSKEDEIEGSMWEEKVKYSYSALNINGGIRYSVFLNSNTSLFVGGAYSFSLFQKGKQELFDKFSRKSKDFVRSGNFIGSIGCRRGNFLGEIRYRDNRQLLDYVFQTVKISSVSVVLGYTLWGR